jgi:hypothetical protein
MTLEVRHRLAAENVGFVVSIAARFRDRGLSRDAAGGARDEDRFGHSDFRTAEGFVTSTTRKRALPSIIRA